ncbi:hypothetical protein D0T12_28980 [Actinomadura spongiicola]|uniref:Replication-relaxation n=1 Tax=Actinomadura spongiicola TaxID=2303421 RepID=A0A372G8Q8_9ACTN|nr:replication-relaxation family protein [Actinomadura spongiicola]RFS81765.1 hypothetical protein D0T12_28980 [Actinomadura spongiicola]
MTGYAIPYPLPFGLRFRIRIRLRSREVYPGLSAQVGASKEPNRMPKFPPEIRPSSLRSSGQPSQPPTPPNSAGPPRPPSRVKTRTNWLDNRLTNRDREIIATLYRLNSATIGQIHRLHFDGLTLRSCQYVMRRLLDWHAVSATERRMGGVLSGSGQTVYSLDPSAHRLMRLAEGRKGPQELADIKPGRWSHRHALVISELYVQCVEAVRKGRLQLADFIAEPACWQDDGNGGYLRPDAYIKVAVPDTNRRQHWWIEVDLGTESTPTVRAKFDKYMDFIGRNVAGPDGTIPRILVTVEDDNRCAALRRIVSRMGDQAAQFIYVSRFDLATFALAAFANSTTSHGEGENRDQ